jgi:hypothetical protein
MATANAGFGRGLSVATPGWSRSGRAARGRPAALGELNYHRLEAGGFDSRLKARLFFNQRNCETHDFPGFGYDPRRATACSMPGRVRRTGSCRLKARDFRSHNETLRSSITSPRQVGVAGVIPSDVKNRVEAAPVRIGGVGRGRAGTIPLPHRCVPGAADSWPAIVHDHLYLHDARVARIDGLVDGPGTGSVRPGVA